MSVTVEIANTSLLQHARRLLNADSDTETVDKALHSVVEQLEPDQPRPLAHDLPDEFWDELFAMPMIPSSVVDDALRKERA